MFIFIEDSEQPVMTSHVMFKHHGTFHVMVREPQSFEEQIKRLGQWIKKSDVYSVMFYNFFSKGCTKLTDSQIRGLERIVLSEGGLIIGKPGRTRFIQAIKRKEWKPFFASFNESPFAPEIQSIGIGAFKKGNTLIVGEKPGSNSLGYNTPFVGTGSGQWLLDFLETNNISENKYYWINAQDLYGRVAEQDFIDDLSPSKIICLGNKAYDWAKNLAEDFTVVKVPHPQYWKRFKSGQPYPLLKEL